MGDVILPDPLESLRLLRRSGANVDAATNAGETVLQELVKSGHVDAVEWLREYCTNINAQTEVGETALHWAAANGNPDMVDILLQCGGDTSLKTARGETPLDCASRNKNSEVRELLAQNGAGVAEQNPNARSEAPGKAKPGLSPDITLWAVLIGIDEYAKSNYQSSGFSNLNGCVNDILLVEEYLRDFLGVNPSRVTKLTSGQDENNTPTYQNIIRALESTTAAASPGDSVYIHYSGQGREIPSVFSSLKGRGHPDASLIPEDINGDGQPLRDLELEYLMRKMVDKGLAVTAVIDSPFCHADMALRHGTLSRSDIEATPGQYPINFNAINEYFDPEAPQNQGKSFRLQPKGYTLFVTPHSQETETHGKHYGVLTYQLIKLLREGSATDCSCRVLYRRLRASITGQEPVVIGELDRTFHGVKAAEIPPVQQVEMVTR